MEQAPSSLATDNFPEFNATQSTNTDGATDCWHLSFSWARWIQSTPSPPLPSPAVVSPHFSILCSHTFLYIMFPHISLYYVPTHFSAFKVFTFLQFFPTENPRTFFSFVDPSGNLCPLIPSTSFRIPLCHRVLPNDTHQASHAHKHLAKAVYFGASCCEWVGGGLVI